MTTQELLEKAIKEKKQVTATYKDLKREMCPHCLGEKSGSINCLFYQFAGESSTRPIIPGSQENWRCIDISKLKDVSLKEGPWHTAENHSKKQTCVDDVYCEVETD
jgi:hypothetical protein